MGEGAAPRALGEEVQGPLSHFIDDLTQTPATTLPTKPKEYPYSAKHPKGWLRTILFSVYLEAAVTLIRAAMIISLIPRALSQSTLHGVWASTELWELMPEPVRVWVENEVAAIRKATPDSLKWTCSQGIEYGTLIFQLYHGLRDKLWNMLVSWFKQTLNQMIASYLHCPEILEELQKHLIPYHAPLTATVNKVLGIDKLSYELATGGILEPNECLYQLSIKPQIIPISIKTDATKRSESLSLIREALSSIRSVDGANVEKYLEACHQWISTGNMGKQIQSSLFGGSSEKFEVTVEGNFIIKALEALLIPQREKKDYWDEVKDPAKAISILSDLSVRLTKGNGERGPTLAALTTTLAIMHKLLLRCPEMTWLKKERINIFEIPLLLKNTGATLNDPQSFQRLEEAFRYFSDIDLKDLPPEKEIDKLAKGSLFDYSDFSLDGSFLKASGSNIAELCYLKTLLNDEKIQKELEHHVTHHSTHTNLLDNVCQGINEVKKILEVPIDDLTPEVTESEKLNFLFEHSLDFTSHLISQPYKELRLQTLLLNSWMRICFSPRFAKIKQTSSNLEMTPHFLPKVQNLFKGLRVLYDTDLDCYLTRKKSYVCGYLFDIKTTQSDIISHATKTYQDDTCWHKEMLDLPIGRDRLIRRMGFMCRYKNYFNCADQYIRLKALFFRIGHLDAQLKEYPQLALTIGEFFQEMENYYKKDGANYIPVAELGVKLYRYCKHCVPEKYLSTFPNFRKELVPFVNHPDSKVKASLTYLATFDPQIEKLSKEDRLEVCEVTLGVLWHYRNCSDKERKSDLDRILEESGSFLMRVGQVIDCVEAMKGEERDILLNRLLDQYEIDLAKHSGTWERIDLMQYRKGPFFLDLMMGKFVGEKSSGLDIVTEVWSLVHEKTSYCLPLKMVADGLFFTSDGTFSAEIDTTAGSLTIYLHHADGRRYRYMDQLRYCLKKSFLDQSIDFKPEDRLWVEETTSESKRVKVYGTVRQGEQPKEKHTLLVTVIPEENETLYRIDEIVDLGLIPIDPESVAYQLDPITRFCPLKRMVCWKNNNEDTLKRFQLIPCDLTFDIERNGNVLQAKCRQMRDYILHPTQKAEGVDFPAYLLLTHHDKDDKKVLLPKNRWEASLLWNGLSLLNSWEKVAKAFLAPLQHNEEFFPQNGKVDYYTYTLEEGMLTHPEPEPTAYLILLYLLQGDGKRAMRACTALELKGWRQSLPDGLLKMLIPLAFLPGSLFPEAPRIRRKLLALFEENRLLQVATKEKTSKNKTSREVQEEEEKTRPLMV